MVFCRRLDPNSSGSWVSLGERIDVVCDEAIFILPSNLSRKAIACVQRDSPLANFLGK